MVFNSGDFKNGISFSFRILSDPAKGAWGGGWGLSKDHVIYQFLGTINSGDFKSETSFSFRIPSDPPKVVLGGWRGGGWDLYTTKDNELDQF